MSISTANTIRRNCPACDCDNRMITTSKYSAGDWDLKKCSCGFVYLENVLPYQALEEGEYEWSASFVAEKSRRVNKEPVLHAIHKMIKYTWDKVRSGNTPYKLINRYVPDGKILDIGCGGGGHFHKFDPKFIIYGIEISKQLAIQAKMHNDLRENGGDVFGGNALEVLLKLEPEYFAGVIMCAYLEHEINLNPVIQEAFRILKPGGHMIVKVPNYGSVNRMIRGNRWCGFRFPEHVNHFTAISLSDLLCKAGFIIKRFNFIDRLTTSDSLWIVVEKPCE